MAIYGSHLNSWCELHGSGQMHMDLNVDMIYEGE